MDGLCRLCAESRSVENLYQINDAALNIERKLVDCCRWAHLKDLTADVVLPQTICNCCIEKLEQCWQFAESVAHTQHKFVNDSKLVSNDFLDSANEDGPRSGDEEMIDYDENTIFLIEIPGEKDQSIVHHFSINTKNGQIDLVESPPNQRAAEKSAKTLKPSNDKLGVDVNTVKAKGNKSKQVNTDGNDEDQDENDERLLHHPANFARKFLSLLNRDERNGDGTIDSDVIHRLGLVNWMVLQHQCWICSVCFCSSYELKAHVATEHAKNEMRYICSMCEPTNTKTYVRQSILQKHTIRKHLAHLKYW